MGSVADFIPVARRMRRRLWKNMDRYEACYSRQEEFVAVTHIIKGVTTPFLER